LWIGYYSFPFNNFWTKSYLDLIRINTLGLDEERKFVAFYLGLDKVIFE